MVFELNLIAVKLVQEEALVDLPVTIESLVQVTDHMLYLSTYIYNCMRTTSFYNNILHVLS
jgi:hypothetical protein